MDYQNRAGSKKGAGGIASDAQANIHRRRQVDALLSKGEDVPFSFQGEPQDDKVRKNPYIYKNRSGKLVCKLCNTMHMSWSSVERHINGKKHALNVMRRERGPGGKNKKTLEDQSQVDYERRVAEAAERLKQDKNLKPKDIKVIPVAGGKRYDNNSGLTIIVNYNIEGANDILKGNERELPPFVKIMSDLELGTASTEEKKKKFIVVSYPPFATVGIEIPNKEIYESASTTNQFNPGCTDWYFEDGIFVASLIFKDEESEGVN